MKRKISVNNLLERECYFSVKIERWQIILVFLYKLDFYGLKIGIYMELL